MSSQRALRLCHLSVSRFHFLEHWSNESASQLFINGRKRYSTMRPYIKGTATDSLKSKGDGRRKVPTYLRRQQTRRPRSETGTKLQHPTGRKAFFTKAD